MVKCKKHPKYTGVLANPTGDCLDCWKLRALRQEDAVKMLNSLHTNLRNEGRIVSKEGAKFVSALEDLILSKIPMGGGDGV